MITNFKLFEKVRVFNDDDLVRIKKTGEIGEITSTLTRWLFGIATTTHLIEIDGISQVYKPKELEKLTSEEIEFYKNIRKYNL